MKTIFLTKGFVAVVDDEDFDFVNQWKWSTSLSRCNGAYAKRAEVIDGKLVRFSMHRLLMRAPEGVRVDHQDRNGLNNQKSNLRLATQVQNCANRKMSKNNTSGFKGVSWSGVHQKWKAQIMHNWKKRHIGLFLTARAAAEAYDRESVSVSGEFAATNKILGLL